MCCFQFLTCDSIGMSLPSPCSYVAWFNIVIVQRFIVFLCGIYLAVHAAVWFSVFPFKWFLPFSYMKWICKTSFSCVGYNLAEMLDILGLVFVFWWWLLFFLFCLGLCFFFGVCVFWFCFCFFPCVNFLLILLEQYLIAQAIFACVNGYICIPQTVLYILLRYSYYTSFSCYFLQFVVLHACYFAKYCNHWLS